MKKYPLRLLILLLILLIVVGIFYFQKNSSDRITPPIKFPFPHRDLTEEELAIIMDRSPKPYVEEEDPILVLPQKMIEVTEWETFTNNNLSFNYPKGWLSVYEEDGEEEGKLELVVRVVNPKNPGVDGTPASPESIVVREMTYPCSGERVKLDGKEAYDSGWDEGWLFYGRSICLPDIRENRNLDIFLIAYSAPMEFLMNQMLLTFKFK